MKPLNLMTINELAEALNQLTAELPAILDAAVTTDDYILIKDNSTNQPKKLSLAQLVGLLGSLGLDADLVTIAALTPANDDILQRKAGAWTSRTIAQYLVDLNVVQLTGNQSIDGNKTFNGELLLNQAGSRFTRSVDSATTAFAGGGQVGATQMTGVLTRITVCATNGDSVKLGAAIAGRTHKIINDGVATCYIFPNIGQSVNGVVDGFIPVVSGGWIEFQCVIDGDWRIVGTNTSTLSAIKGSDGTDTGFGILKLKSKTASVAFAGGATETIAIQVPKSYIVGVSLRNDTILTAGGGGVSYTAALSAGGDIGVGVNFVKNTKVDTFMNQYVGAPIDIILTPDAGTLDTGTVTAVVYYYELTSITDAP